MGNAARALGPAAMTARQVRAAADDVRFREARDALAGALRAEAIRVLVMNGVPAEVREDLAQAVTVNVLGRIIEGRVEPGFEDGYLAVAAKNRARDWHRETSGVYEKTEVYEEDFFPSPTPDPQAALESAESEREIAQLTERLRAVVQCAPPRYREVLVAVYLEGVAIDALVDQELFREWPLMADDPIATRRRARARVDKLLQRARDWVRARMVDDALPMDARTWR
jgi:RNA polymerase sigma factor (sigma-70 family)